MSLQSLTTESDLQNSEKDNYMRYTGPKNKIARRENMDLGLKTLGSKSHANLMKKIMVIPGQHGASRRSKPTDYGIQLREKQKVKRIYGLNERQMKNNFGKASKLKGNTAELFISILERRLDNVVYRLGFAPTRGAARQMVTHGHIAVNGKKLDISSYSTKKDDVISFLKDKSVNIPYIASHLENADVILPAWVEKKKNVGKVISLPTRDDVSSEINLQLVVEFYSR